MRSLKHEFVEFIPEQLAAGVLYISVQYATVAHACCCGCGGKVVTPLTPTDWTLSFDGATVSLNPSVGNWNFPCRSHYWIRQNLVRWAAEWTDAQILEGRSHDSVSKELYFAGLGDKKLAELKVSPEFEILPRGKRSIWKRLHQLMSWK
jgi:hypothetical protein